VGAEVLQRTWDFQRLSVLTPWQMTLGKLAGATSLSWLAALSGLVVANLAFALGPNPAPALEITISAIAAAVLLQAGSLALALVGVRRARADGRSAPSRIGWTSALGVVLLFWVARRTLPGGTGLGTELLPGFGGGRLWWGLAVSGSLFNALSLTAFAAWAVIAAWRLMRLELQTQNWPWAWPGFLVFAALYAAGFTHGAAMGWAAAGIVFGIGAYASAFAEPADRVRLRHWVGAVRTLDWKTLYLTVPAPYSALKLGALAAVGLMLSAPERALSQPAPLALAAFAFLARDIGLIAYFRFGPRTRRGDFGAVLGLFLLYFVGGMVGRALGGPAGAALFVPSPNHALLSAGAGVVMAVLAWVLAWSRIRAPETTGGLDAGASPQLRML
jgi:hypothetical protein